MATSNVRTRRAVRAGVALTAGAVGWGLYESQWVRVVERDVPVAGLAPELSGLRVAHLSDLHVGAPGLNVRALRRAVDLVVAAGPDVVCITGDLRARRSGDAALRRELARIDPPHGAYAVLGNHDHGDGHDPFADDAVLDDLDGTRVELLLDRAVETVVGGRTVRIAGADPRSVSGSERTIAPTLLGSADLRILLCHFPYGLDVVRPGTFDLLLAGHLHGGQICLPWPTGKVRLAHVSRDYLEGVYAREGTAMHVTRGVGTTFVPFRFAARPEVAILTLVATGAA
jgi:predicted MPP superfamily phosphohydrolase